ncbi:ABC transporter permease [Trebonia sp.]|uniref:ABC transporter permease n=1 Tax=Trebonia sp. TaxID=2767075 RepID=UPI003BAECF03
MFWTYLRRELRRRIRQAVFIALGLALGIGLVITVTSAATGVQNAQAAVLHSLYGVGTDLTVTQPPKQGSGAGLSFGFKQQIKQVRSGQISAGTTINDNELQNTRYGTLTASQLAGVSRQQHVTAATGALALTDITATGTVPALKAGSGTFSSSFKSNTFTVDGVDVARGSPRPLSSATVTAGRNFGQADATADVALADSGYATANKLKTGSTVDIGGTTFTIVGIVSVPQGSSPPSVYIPLAKAQRIGATGTAKLTNQVNTIYVAADSAADIPAVQQELTKLLPSATVTDASDLASQVTGSVGSAASLAGNLGKWLSVAVLAAAFGLAILLTMAAVTRRVREFGTLKALGWRSRRIIGQVLGESIAIGIVGGVAGVALGYGGAALIDKFAPKLSASTGAPPATASGVAGKLAQQISSATTHTVYVTLTAPVTLGVILLAVVLAVAGGLLAGMFGGWRAARLRPAAALAKVE